MAEQPDFPDHELPPQEAISIPDVLPVMALRDAVLFPYAIIPLTVGREISKRAGQDGKRRHQFADEIAAGDHGEIDSLLLLQNGKLLFESYYRRGRINYPHYQMSITKSYTAMALGRAIQLGHLTMDDLDKPAISFLKELKPSALVKGADDITLHQAMHMSSGIRLDKEKADVLRQQPQRLKGQGQIQAYLEHSAPIPPAPREFKYQASDPAITMQVLEAVVPDVQHELGVLGEEARGEAARVARVAEDVALDVHLGLAAGHLTTLEQ